ncbi:hypothetical protein [Rubinisphaera italica]|uniref:hypothetical protein n=1 Tax=Rubinisphaera italica TaxID=2527969 RepID=UPI0011B6831A|nr:hypothetical protein [Rubinisphaera italica]
MTDSEILLRVCRVMKSDFDIVDYFEEISKEATSVLSEEGYSPNEMTDFEVGNAIIEAIDRINHSEVIETITVSDPVQAHGRFKIIR